MEIFCFLIKIFHPSYSASIAEMKFDMVPDRCTLHVCKSQVSIKVGVSQSVVVILKTWIGFLNILAQRKIGKIKKKKMPTETVIKFFETGQFSQVGRERANKYLFYFSLAHETMVLFFLLKLILQTHMRSHPVGLDVWGFAGRPCGKYHNLMS